MTPKKKQILEEKKQKLKCEIAFKNFEQSSILPFIEILEEVKKLEIEYEITEICYIKNEWKDMIQKVFEKTPFINYHLSKISISNDNPLIEKLLDLYPNTNPIRYVPNLPVVAKYESDNSKVLKSLIKNNLLTDQHVYLYYFQYAFLLKINLSALAEKAIEELFNFFLGDAVIFPEDYRWIIAHSLEEEWQFGFKD